MDAVPASAGSLDGHVLRLVLPWYFVRHPKRIVHLYQAYASAFAEVFSFVFLLKTLFAPWKNIKDAYPKKGFNLQAILESWSLNLTTRAIGMVIRICTMFMGLLAQVVLLVGFITYLLIWLTFPVLVPAILYVLYLQ
jgi:hypothetical protein